MTTKIKASLFLTLVVGLSVPDVSSAGGASSGGLNGGLQGLYRIDPTAKSRSISPENFTGEKGRGGLGTKRQEKQWTTLPIL